MGGVTCPNKPVPSGDRMAGNFSAKPKHKTYIKERTLEKSAFAIGGDDHHSRTITTSIVAKCRTKSGRTLKCISSSKISQSVISQNSSAQNLLCSKSISVMIQPFLPVKLQGQRWWCTTNICSLYGKADSFS